MADESTKMPPTRLQMTNVSAAIPRRGWPILPVIAIGLVLVGLVAAAFGSGLDAWHVRGLEVVVLGALWLVTRFFRVSTNRLVRRAADIALVVGDDGVSVQEGTVERFVHYLNITKVRRSGARLMLHTRDGQSFILTDRRAAGSVERVKAAYRRIAEGREAAAALKLRSRERDDAKATLARGHRSPTDWIAALRQLADHETYRENPLGRDRLWSIVENGVLDEPQRAAAAVSLLPTLDADGKKRLRVAAEASISPKIRVALEEIAETSGSDDRALEEILERVESSKSQLKM